MILRIKRGIFYLMHIHLNSFAIFGLFFVKIVE